MNQTEVAGGAGAQAPQTPPTLTIPPPPAAQLK
jgi:hypothetical protein